MLCMEDITVWRMAVRCGTAPPRCRRRLVMIGAATLCVWVLKSGWCCAAARVGLWVTCGGAVALQGRAAVLAVAVILAVTAVLVVWRRRAAAVVLQRR